MAACHFRIRFCETSFTDCHLKSDTCEVTFADFYLRIPFAKRYMRTMLQLFIEKLLSRDQ